MYPVAATNYDRATLSGMSFQLSGSNPLRSRSFWCLLITMPPALVGGLMSKDMGALTRGSSKLRLPSKHP